MTLVTHGIEGDLLPGTRAWLPHNTHSSQCISEECRWQVGESIYPARTCGHHGDIPSGPSHVVPSSFPGGCLAVS